MEFNTMWKEGKVWKVQATKGILTFKTKKRAVQWVEMINQTNTK